MDEPIYVDDPFEGDAPDLTDSGIVNIDILKIAQYICRRPTHPFHKPSEKNRWLKIDRQVTKGMISGEWLENCFEWARDKNKGRLAITLPALTSLILNKGRMQEFHTKLAQDMGIPSEEEGNLADEGF